MKEYNLSRKCNVLIVFDDMIADMISNNEFSPVVTELLIRKRKLNIPTVFITQSYSQVPKDFSLNSIDVFIMTISNKQELQQIPFNHSSDMNSKGFMNLYNKYSAKQYAFLVIDITLVSDNSLRFRNNLLERI